MVKMAVCLPVKHKYATDQAMDREFKGDMKQKVVGLVTKIPQKSPIVRYMFHNIKGKQ